MKWFILPIVTVLISCDAGQDPAIHVHTFGFDGQELVGDAVTGKNGGLIVAGTTTSVNGQMEIMVGAFDADLQMSWMKAIGGNQSDRAFASILVEQDAVVVTGYLSPSVVRGGWLARISDQGVLQWQNYFSQFPSTELRSVIRHGDRYYCVGKENLPHGYAELSLIVAGSDGKLISKNNYRSEHNLSLEGLSLVQLNATTLVMAGTADNATDLPEGGRNVDFIFFAIDLSGAVKWRTQVDLGDREIISHVVATGDGGILGIGTTVFQNIFGQGTLVRIDSAGNLLWSHHGMVGTGTEFHRGLRLEDGSFLIVGTDNRDVFVMRVTDSGTVLWQSHAGGPDLERGRSLIPIGKNRYRIVGIQYDVTDADILFMEISPNGEFR